MQIILNKKSHWKKSDIKRSNFQIGFFSIFRLENIAINQCCTLVYTSGTTGNPKGVMLSHDNIYWEAETANDFYQMEVGKEVGLSYLPLSHVAGKWSF